ncbi:sel1 repeat family protein [Pseudomonas sp. N040]|nr:sel1 repeat family protein [Pseudomonas sp. N040]
MPVRIIILLATLFLTVVLNTAQAGLAEGVAAIAKGDFKTALVELQPLAEQGNPDAQFNLGLMYFNGTGVPQDDQAALKWFRLAADQGDAFAQFALGNMYFMGRGVETNLVASYALGNLAAAEVPGYFTQPAQMRDFAAGKMNAQQLEEGQALTRAMREGNLLTALDDYLQDK